MDVYKKAIEICLTVNKPEKKTNDFIKLMINSEDEKLNELINTCVIVHKRYIKPGMCLEYRFKSSEPEWMRPKNHDQWEQSAKKACSELKDYCREIIAERKPNWQVLAERAGWAKIS